MASYPGTSTMLTSAANLDDAQTMRHAGRDLLSLALIDARNRSLRLYADFESADPSALADGAASIGGSPLWWLGQLGWMQEVWIARNVQRHRGRQCDARGIRLASIDPRADHWWDPRLRRSGERGPTYLPNANTVRQYLVDTLEVTLELLNETPEDDQALYFFRHALFHEDRQAERLIEAAQWRGVHLSESGSATPYTPHGALHVPAGCWRIGTDPHAGGYLFEEERGLRTESFREHEIDAQPVTWQQFLQFVADGGYRQSRWWTSEGWEWVCQHQRIAPAPLLDPDNGLRQWRFGQQVHVPSHQAVVHVNVHEAQAWCRWAGRRLPTEVEWTHAAQQLQHRGFRWGDVWEWTADRLTALEPDLWDCNLPAHEEFRGSCYQHRVLKGGSAFTRGRLRDPHLRPHRPPKEWHGLTGFRSCSL